MSTLMQRLKKASKLGAVELKDSDIYKPEKYYRTDIPALNIILSGDIDGGLTRGITLFAGPSKHFKTLFGLLCVKAYQDASPTALCSFLDNEFGTTPPYFTNVGVDTDRWLYAFTPNLEDIKVEAVSQLMEVKKGEEMMLFIDSMGNVASKKEMKDAEEGESKEDAGRRAKEAKSVLRTIAPYINQKNLPMVAIGHTYKTMEQYSKDVVSGGTGLYYNANNIIIPSRKKLKQGENDGNIFTLRIEKSRFCIEQSKIEIKVSYEHGIIKYSGLLDIAEESGHVTKPKVGWYTRPSVSGDKNWREAELEVSDDFWSPIISDQSFKDFIKKKYQLTGALLKNNGNAPLDLPEGPEDEDDE